jgi:hypothetical protein
MKIQIILIFLLLLVVSCASQKREIIAKSTIKLEGQNTNIRNLIEIDGYYQDTDTLQYSSYMMFFEDGVWATFHVITYVRLSENERRAKIPKSVKNWMEKKEMNWVHRWGVYKIVEDTLVVYYYDKGHFWKGWSFYETRYKVIDRTTILPIYSKGLLKTDEQYDKTINFNPWIKNRDKLYFNSADSLPSSDCWLKEEKWIWRNEKDWKDYMQKVKQIRKEYKKR